MAQAAGVSPSTVSLVLSNRGDEVGIAKATQERVVNAARDLGYVPNSLMQSILRGRTNIIGLFMGWEQWAEPHAYWMEVLRGIQASAARLGQEILLHSDPPDKSTEEIFARQASGIVDGVIMLQGGQELADRLAGSSVPCILLGAPHTELPSVHMNSDGGVRQVVEHLHRRGYQRLAYVGPETKMSVAPEVRYNGYAEAVRALGRAEDASRLVEGDEGTQILEGLLALGPRPDAAVCFNDRLAYRLLGACNQAGISVPGELAITGFDCIPIQPGTPQVTTVRSDIMEMCHRAMTNLIDLIEGRPIQRETVLEVEIEPGVTS